MSITDYIKLEGEEYGAAQTTTTAYSQQQFPKTVKMAMNNNTATAGEKDDFVPPSIHQRTLSNLSASEDLFSSITGFDDLAADDDLSFDDDNLGDFGLNGSNSEEGGNGSGNGPAKKGKRAASTAEKKATHNAVERARRESLNGRFLVLADMLPGMNNIKRASKAAIVNKSIDLIKELRQSQTRSIKEVESLKAELAALRSGQGLPPSPTATTAPNVPQQQQAQQAAQSAASNNGQQAAQFNAAAAAAAAQQAAAFHHHQLLAAAAAAGMPGMANMPPHAMNGMFPHPAMMHQNNPESIAAMMAAAAAAHHQSQSQNQHMQNPYQQNQPQAQHHFDPSAAFPGAAAAMAAYGFFGNHAPSINGAENIETVRSESGSPSSLGGHPSAALTAPFQHPGGFFDMAQAAAAAAAAAQFANSANGSFGNSPASANYNSPPGTVASLAGSERTNTTGSAAVPSSNSGSTGSNNNSAPSPASSHSVATPPMNSYSPITGHAFMMGNNPASQQGNMTSNGAGAGQQQQQQQMADPAIAAFDAASDAAFLAARFAPSDLAKAQQELQGFIAYQQRMASSMNQPSPFQQQHPLLQQNNMNSTPSPTSTSFERQGTPLTPGFAAPASFGGSNSSNNNAAAEIKNHQQQLAQAQAAAAAAAAMYGNSAAAMAGIPAWQMMMAQHQAMASQAHNGNGSETNSNTDSQMPPSSILF